MGTKLESTAPKGIEKLGDAPPRDGSLFRAVIATMALTAGVAGMGGLFFVDIPDQNENALILAIGIVLGWGSTVINYEFGSSPSGRKAADAGVRGESNQ